MVGDGTVRKAWSVKRGDLPGTGAAFMAGRPEEPRRAGVRASIVAEKRRNGRGAKGRREMDS